jgi:acetyl-CoA C-acetyltransferase
MTSFNNQALSQDPIVIVASQRTAIGQFQGQFSSYSAPQLAAEVIKTLLEQSKISHSEINEVILGCVLSAGIGQAPARQAALFANLSNQTGCTTINKMCGSGLKAIMFAHDLLLAGTNDIMIAGGMESMTNAPYLLNKARAGLRMGHATLFDHMFLDGLEDAYEKNTLMGVFAERCAKNFGFTREQQDNFTLESLSRSQQAIKNNLFKAEITAINSIDTDELPLNAKPDKIPLLKPAFEKNGTVTAANSSGISDGASAQLMMRWSKAKTLGLKPLAKILGHSTYSTLPADFTIAPIGAMKLLLEKLNLNTHQIDLFEINEAFSVVTLAAIQELKLDIKKVNIHGGACAMGHPIGASGSRIVTTLLHALKHHQLKTGMASLCIGGGEAVALALELIN